MDLYDDIVEETSTDKNSNQGEKTLVSSSWAQIPVKKKKTNTFIPLTQKHALSKSTPMKTVKKQVMTMIPRKRPRLPQLSPNFTPSKAVLGKTTKKLKLSSGSKHKAILSAFGELMHPFFLLFFLTLNLVYFS